MAERLMARETLSMEPVRVRVNVPVVAVGLAARLRMDMPGETTGLVEKVAVIPAPRPESFKDTGEERPLMEATSIIMLVELP